MQNGKRKARSLKYQALYRKYRPQVFEDVKGQEVIVKTLRNQIRTNRIGHAYLFCGSRGTGKTTAAKIFARAINCENPEDGNPCGVCASCRAILGQTSMNVIEMDAASRNGVDDFRQIIDEIAYPPAEGRYKVYIIDEVHMLSPAAFNAFLKTLEEPPSYAVFILATTDPQKLPATILSRCQRYDFRRIPTRILADRIREVLSAEGVEAEDQAVRFIARRAEGGMRDALSIADQCISFYTGEKLTYTHVLEVLGTVDTEVYSSLLENAVSQDASGALNIFGGLVMDGRDIRQIVSDLTWYIRDLLLYKASGGNADSLDLMDEGRERMERDGRLTDENQLMYYIEVLSDLANQLRTSSNRRILTEVALIRLCRPQTRGRDLTALEVRMNRIEQMIEEGKISPALSASGEDAGIRGSFTGEAAFVPGDKAGDGQGTGDTEGKLPETVAPELFRRIKSQWKSTMESIENPGWRHILADYGDIWYQKDDNTTLFVRLPWNFADTFVGNRHAEEMVENALAVKYGTKPTVKFQNARDAGTGGMAKVNDLSAQIKARISFDIETEDDPGEGKF